ncbi:hypothetical protein COHA_006065 [Chlorella ohadii]|uniref:NADP-dependent oxidoreductase domain-containing protein n=1 Tax=Chlorella ohadii TaxID=2649997 RepID=A0AAD5DPT7_9CHLO|nr:hypothetical protein COHA_006065 [Chlorella ohadii]
MEEQPIRLGKSGPEIAGPLGMGLWSWGDSYTWGHGGYDATLTAASMQEAYQAALHGGCNLFDTAESYGAPFHWGASERFLADCMRAEGSQAAGNGLKPVVVSKYIPLPWRLFEPRCMLAALRSSVDRLGVEAVDCYLVHSPVATFRSIQTLASSLAAAVDSGLAKSVGVSNYSEAEVRETHRVLAERGIPLAVNQAHGGKTPAQVALNWLICKGAVPIPGAKSQAQAESNVGALGWRLSEGDVSELDELAIEGSLKFGQHG